MSWLVLVALTGLFVGLHLLPFGLATRDRLTGALGANGYKIAYTILSIIGLFGAFFVADAVPLVELWSTSTALRWLALVLTFLGFVLLGAAYGPGDGTRLARHPMLAGMALWAGAHVLANGDLGHLLVFGAISAYAVAAMFLSDQRAAQRDETAFAGVQARTTLVPFLGLVRGQGVEGLRWQGPAVGLAGWAVFLTLHGWLFAASPWP